MQAFRRGKQADRATWSGDLPLQGKLVLAEKVRTLLGVVKKLAVSFCIPQCCYDTV